VIKYKPTIVGIVIVCGFVIFSYCRTVESESGNPANENANENTEILSKINSVHKGIAAFLPSSTTGQVVVHNGFTLSYNEKFEESEWVAYELKSSELRSSNYKRPFFIEDPKVKTHSADWRNYKKSGYDKGHLCPAADRKFSKAAFDETFYTSNIAPQKHNFNGGVWNRLEQKVRYWAQRYDGIYVITAGILNDKLKTIGKEDVAIPEYYYKVLLNEDHGKYKMIGFLVPHTDSEKPLREFVVPVDRIEQLTGIDFFPQLDDAIENDLETNADYKAWSFN